MNKYYEITVKPGEELPDEIGIRHMYDNDVEVYVRKRASEKLCRDQTIDEKAIDGRFVGEKHTFRCSSCNFEYSSIGGFGCDFGDEPWFSYCPCCGAKVINIGSFL